MERHNIIQQSFKEKSEFEDSAASIIANLANKAIEERGSFSIVLCGGSTPKSIYSKLAKAQTDWSAWYVYFGDERCLAENNSERNSVMASESWFMHCNIPSTQIFPIRGEIGNEKAASEYENIVLKAPKFDLVLLGFGEDGHIASLFPGHEWDDRRSVIPVYNAPKLPSERVSLTVRGLTNARDIIFLVTGKNKAKAFQAWINENLTPASLISANNNVKVLTYDLV
ncbi:MAG: 6-phosphogluconolactonase [Methylophilales bacterium]|jgi:6-phosphogluconolactonase|nr:6-phosphogluconolactonase [Pseudomonadota bacterium]NQW35233.1 6-phosphogluconolactonase [Methylophilales bacterium]HCK04281.1 6-phosphogluconolactonase [Methylophilaceae bacterium]|tara:strand:- start:358 stop:1035 length:678 start_codon:yes stop_codon:yes gene_type:complete